MFTQLFKGNPNPRNPCFISDPNDTQQAFVVYFFLENPTFSEDTNVTFYSFDINSVISPCCSLIGHHTLAPSQPEPIITRTSSHTLSPDQTRPILTRSASYREPSLTSMKRASAEVEVLTPPSPLGNRDNMMTFSSSTLPRYSHLRIYTPFFCIVN